MHLYMLLCEPKIRNKISCILHLVVPLKLVHYCAGRGLDFTDLTNMVLKLNIEDILHEGRGQDN